MADSNLIHASYEAADTEIIEFERWFISEIQNGNSPNEFQKFKREL